MTTKYIFDANVLKTDICPGFEPGQKTPKPLCVDATRVKRENRLFLIWVK